MLPSIIKKKKKKVPSNISEIYFFFLNVDFTFTSNWFAEFAQSAKHGSGQTKSESPLGLTVLGNQWSDALKHWFQCFKTYWTKFNWVHNGCFKPLINHELVCCSIFNSKPWGHFVCNAFTAHFNVIDTRLWKGCGKLKGRLLCGFNVKHTWLTLRRGFCVVDCALASKNLSFYPSETNKAAFVLTGGTESCITMTFFFLYIKRSIIVWWKP